MRRKAIIFGIKGLKLTSSEIKLFRREKPWGVILFSRNIDNFYQLKDLTTSIRKTMGDKSYPILIDEEGGQVSRLNKIIDLNFFSQQYFGELYKTNKKNFIYNYNIYIDKISSLLKNVGININTVPVLDVKRKFTHPFIKKRTFSDNPSIVVRLGKHCIDLYKKKRIATVMKHIPGHGLSRKDSHYDLPIVNKNQNELIKKDFLTFKNCKSLFAMTAHIIYSNYDSNFPATHSKIIIKKIIRKHIGFKGILISDDISMKSLKYGLKKNAILALESGCNLILHCNGKISQMNTLVKIVPEIDKFTKKKTSDFYKFLG